MFFEEILGFTCPAVDLDAATNNDEFIGGYIFDFFLL